MFRTAPLSIIRSFSLYTQQYTQVCWQLAVSKPIWHKPLLCVQWNTPDDGQRNCPKHVDFYYKNKFEKLVHLVGFIIRMKYEHMSFYRYQEFAIQCYRIRTLFVWGPTPRSDQQTADCRTKLHYSSHLPVVCQVYTTPARVSTNGFISCYFVLRPHSPNCF